MRSDRAYRRGLSKEEALGEIVRNVGTQFHPAVAKAFVAAQQGLDPYSALTPEEQEQLRGSATRHRLPHVPGARDLKEKHELAALGGLIGALAGVGLDEPLLIVA